MAVGLDPNQAAITALRARDDVDSASSKSTNFRNEMESVHNAISGAVGGLLQGVMGVLNKGGSKGGGKGGGGGKGA